VPPDHPSSRLGQRDLITDVGILVVGLAAAVLTFTTLRDLGESVGYRELLFGFLLLAWLLPVTIDAAGVIAARVWLRAIGSTEAVEFARTLTWSCIGLSVLGNAGRHVMVELGILPPWYVVVLVTAVPPAMLGAVVHLGNLVRRPVAGQQSDQPTDLIPERSERAAQPIPEPADEVFAEPAVGDPTAPVGEAPTVADRQPTAAAADMPTAEPKTLGEILDAIGSAAADGPDGDDPTEPDREPTDEYDRGLDNTADDRVLIGDMQRWSADRGRPVSRDDAVRAYGIGGPRARKLRLACGWPRGADEDADRTGDQPTAVGAAAEQ
jgi:hypothetical protein